MSSQKTPTATEVKEEVKEATKSTLESVRAFAAGGVGGICAVVVGHPFDLVKVRLQTAEKGVYTGAIDVVRKTVAREGLARVRLLVKTSRAYLRLFCTGSLCRCVGTSGRRHANVYVHPSRSFASHR